MGITEKELLDWATRIGVQAKLDDLKKNQIENLIASVDFVEDNKNSLLVVPAYAYRQANRVGGRNTARLIRDAFTWLYDNNGTKEDARKLLGLAKWVFEGVKTEDVKEIIRRVNVNVNRLTLEQLIKIIKII